MLLLQSPVFKTAAVFNTKSSLDGGHISERTPDTNTQASNNLTSEGSVKTEIPEPRFRDGVSATKDNIAQEPLKVKDSRI